MRIFISHASEDKESFVRPLAEALRANYDVWFDEYELTVGDRLLDKINQGLANCDFGVVVLSPSFFGKRWPQEELNGLFALETTARKIILPVWKDITEADVKQYSPMMAARLATRAENGVDAVVKDLRRAIDVSNRTREIDATGSIADRATKLNLTLKEKQNAERLSHCEEGVALVNEAFMALGYKTKSIINNLQQTTPLLGMQWQGPFDPPFGVQYIINTQTPYQLFIEWCGVGVNFTFEAGLSVILSKRRRTFQEPARITEIKFKPTFKLPAEVVWATENGKKTLTTDELAGRLVEILLERIENDT